MLSLQKIEGHMKNVWYIILVGLSLFQSCTKKEINWKFDSEIKLDNIKPIGIAIVNDTLWVSDGEGNRIVQLNKEGKILKEEKGFDRPMHIANFKKGLAIPEYGKDVITILEHGISKALPSPKLDAPAGIDFNNGSYAIADFYHHKIHFYNGKEWRSFGEKGKGNSQFLYPTDLHIADEFLYVADAYNHRIQVFDKEGAFIKIMAEDLGINAATGVFYQEQQVFITDFENHRVLVLENSGELKQILTQSLANPTDMIVLKEKLYVLNFKSGTISIFRK